MMRLDSGTLHILKLTAKDADADGWAEVSKLLWPIVGRLPDDLIEKRPSALGGGGHIRLTGDGKAIVKYA